MMRERFATTATALLDDDPRVAVVTAAISADLFAPAAVGHPDRVVDVGIREQLMIGVGAGMAMTGLRPIVHTYAPFLVERAYEQVKLDLSHQDVDAVLVSVGASYDWAEGGQTHRGHADVALLNTLEGWNVHVPGHDDEVDALLRHAIATGGRHYLRLSTASNGEARARADGRIDVVRTGREATVLAVGPMLEPALESVADLDVTVLYAATVRPLDGDTLRSAATGPVVLVEPYLAGTSLAAVRAALDGGPHRVIAHGVGRTEVRHYGEPAEHDRVHGLDVEGIRRVVSAALG
jgi:transketolase